MKIAFINPPWINIGNTSAIRAGSRWPHIRRNYFKIFPFPYRLAEVTSLMYRDGHEAILIDALAEGLDDSETFQRIAYADFIIVETATNSLKNDINFLIKLRKNFPEAKIATVGQHAVVGANDLKPYCDYVLTHEYDFKVRNIIKGKEPGDELVDINEIPWPYRDPNTFHYYQEGFCTSFPNATVTTSRGCPYACTFCQEPTIFYKKPGLRTRNAEDVINEWEYLIKKFKVKEIYIDDSTFTADEEHVHRLLDQIEKRNLKIKFSAMGDARVSNEVLERLAHNGFSGLKIGIETINIESLKNIKKAWLKISDVERVVKKCRELKIFIHGTFMLGLPGETKETIKKTIEYAIKTPFNFVQFSPFIPMPGTKIYDEVKKKGWLKRSTDSECNIIVDRPGLSGKELNELYEWAQSRISKRVFTKFLLARKYFQLALTARNTNLFKLIWNRLKFASEKNIEDLLDRYS